MAREMKDSGIEWVGRIPKTWKLQKGKTLFEQVSQKGNLRCLQLLSPTQNYGVIPQSLYEEMSGMSAVKLNLNVDLNDLKTVHIGAFCISLRSFQGGFEYSRYEGVVSNAYQIFYGKSEVCNDYYRYLFKDSSFIEKMNSYTMSLRDGKNIAFADFGNTLIPYPSFKEQQMIASYLDSKCSEIDSLVADITREIELLKEYRKSVIYEAVTKGLDPNAEMKDSGIEWIGKIPTNWTIKPLKNLFIFGKGLSITKADLVEEGYPVISYGQIHAKYNTGVCVDNRLFRYVDNSYLKTSSSSLVPPNSFVFADTSEDAEGCGNCVYNDSASNFFAGYHTIILTPRFSQNCKYLAYLFQTDIWRNQIRTRIVEVKLFTVSQKLLRLTSVILPPKEEQAQIVDYLDSKCSLIDSMILEKKQQILKLTEYKKSLIYEYVTGKKEVSAL